MSKPLSHLPIFSFSLLLILSFSFLPIISDAWSATYYVDATNGNDSNNGLSESTVWKTIAKVNASSFNPGDQILFRRGQTWREQLTVPSSGSAGNPITFGAYGSGAKPIIDASNLITPGTSWTAATPTIWTATVTTEPKIVFFNGTWGTKVATQADCTGTGKWHWAVNVLSVYSASDPDTAYMSPGIEVGARDEAVLNAKNYVTFDGLHFRRGNSTDAGNIMSSGNHVTIRSCESSYGVHHGIIYTGSGDNLLTLSNIHHNGTKLDSSGVFGYHDAGTAGHENIISYNNVYNNYSYGIQLLSNYYIIEYNDVYDNGNLTYMGIGIEIIDWDNIGYGRYNIIRYNKAHGQKSALNNGEGIVLDDFAACNSVYYNISYGNDGPGIGLWRSNNNTVYNNVTYGNALNSSGTLTTKTEIALDAGAITLTVCPIRVRQCSRAVM